jgi:hypothetical protein
MLGRNEGAALNTTYTEQSGYGTTAVLPFDYFVDSVNGSDKNAGTSPGAAFQTFAPLAGKTLRQGVGISRGSTVQIEAFVPNNGGRAGSLVIFGSYGTGPLPVLKDSAQVSSATPRLVIGTEYALPSTASFPGALIWWDASGGTGTSATATIALGAPAVVTWTGHGMSDGNGVYFTTTGSLPAGITPNTVYFVVNSTTDTFQLAATIGGRPISARGPQSGIQTACSALPPASWALAGGLLYVNVGRAPTASDVFEVPCSSNTLLNIDGLSNLQFQDLSLRYSGSSGVEVAVTTASDTIHFLRCEFAYANGSLIHCGAGGPATNIVTDTCYLHDQYNLQNGYAHHADGGAGSGTIMNCTLRRLAGSGITCHDTVSLRRYNCVLDGANMLIIGGGKGAPGVHTIVRMQQYNQKPGAQESDYFFQIHAGIPCQPGTVINFYNCSIAQGTMPVQQRCFFHGSGTLRIMNFVWYGGFSIALRGDNVNGSRVTANIAGSIFGNELYYWDVPGSSNVLNGPGDISYGTVDPYTNSTAGDLRPRAGSPLIGTGVAIAGITVGTPPDIGYTGAR